MRRSAFTLGLLLAVGCGAASSAGPAEHDSSGSGGETDPDDAGTTYAASADSGDTDSGSAADSGTTSETTAAPGSDTTSTSESGGDTEVVPIGDVELLVHRYDETDHARFFRYRVVDELSDGLRIAHEATDAAWEIALPVPGHRIVYRTGSALGWELRIGSLDDPLPDETALVMADIITPDYPLLIPDTESLLQVVDHVLYRVDLDEPLPATPQEIVEVAPSPSAFGVDRFGRHVFVMQEGAPGSRDLVYVSLTDFVPQTLTALGPTEWTNLPWMSPSGEHGFFDTFDTAFAGGVTRLTYLRIDENGAVTVTSAHDDIAPPDRILYPESAGTRPSDVAVGTALAIGPQFEGVLEYIGVEDGLSLPPLALHDAAEPVTAAEWSPDGTALTFETRDGDDYDAWMATFGEGHQPTVTSILTSSQDETASAWSADGRWLFVSHVPASEDTQRIATFELTDGGIVPGPEYTSEHQGLRVSNRSTGGRYVFFEEQVLAQTRLLAVDVSGAELADPFVVSGELGPSDRAAFPVSTVDDAIVGYTVFDGGDEALFLVSMEEPGIAYEVTDAKVGWQFVAPD